MKSVSVFLVLITANQLLASENTNSDDIIQPCGSNNIQYDCVRQYFSENGNSDCAVTTPDENPYVQDSLPLLVPVANIKVIIKGAYLSNMDGKIVAFNYNKNTGSLCTAVEYPVLEGVAPNTIIAVGREGKEPAVTTTYANATYPVTITGCFDTSKGINAESVDNAYCFAYFSDLSRASITLGTEFTESSDPAVQDAYKSIYDNIETVLQEIFLVKAHYYWITWFKNFICKLNVDPVVYKFDGTVFESENGIDTNDQSYWNYPCNDSDDLNACARALMQEGGSGTEVQPSNEPVTRGAFPTAAPSTNLTLILKQSMVSGLDGTVTHIHTDNRTGNIVMAVKFNELVVEVDDTEILINQIGQEPLQFTGYTKCTYPITITAVIPLPLSTETMKQAYTFVTIDNSEGLDLELGTDLKITEDPILMEHIKSLQENKLAFTKELLDTAGYSYFIMFVQSQLYDYGIDNTYSPWQQ